MSLENYNVSLDTQNWPLCTSLYTIIGIIDDQRFVQNQNSPSSCVIACASSLGSLIPIAFSATTRK